MHRPDTIIVSYQRSGLNWVRYCAEWFSRQRTPGHKRPIPMIMLKEKKNFLFCRSHNVNSYGPIHGTHCQFFLVNKPIFKKMIMLVRNYKEVFVRQADKRIRKLMPYFVNLQAYEDFPREKLLIYYEDLIADFSYMEKILDFLGVRYDMENFDVNIHARRSRKVYSSGRPVLQKCQTAANPLDFTFHSRKMKQEKKLWLDQFYKDNYPHLFEKYGRRYEEKIE